MDYKDEYRLVIATPYSTERRWSEEYDTYLQNVVSRVVADVVRMGKGHTEGLEPNVTEALVRLMHSAGGGKLRN